jgi:hypothetical protein
VLSPAAASGALLGAGLQFAFGNAAFIVVPNLTADASNAGFVLQGAPIPVSKFSIATAPILTPKKLASISVFTRETFKHSIPDIELMVRAVVSENIALALDVKLLDDVAADAVRPAGLRNGIAAGSASAATPRSEAMAADIATLITAVTSVAGNAPIIIVAAPAQAAALRLWNNPSFDYQVLASSGLAAGFVVAIATNCLVSAVDPLPRFELVPDATLHFDDTSLLDITTASVGTTVKSLVQSDLVALRAILEVSWGLRSASGLAWLSGVTW